MLSTPSSLRRSLLDLQHDLDDIFAHTGDVAEFMQHIRNADGGHSRAVQRGEQDAAQGIAQRHAVATLQRADNEFAVISSFCFALDLRHDHVRDTSHGSPLPLIDARRDRPDCSPAAQRKPED